MRFFFPASVCSQICLLLIFCFLASSKLLSRVGLLSLWASQLQVASILDSQHRETDFPGQWVEANTISSSSFQEAHSEFL